MNEHKEVEPAKYTCNDDKILFAPSQDDTGYFIHLKDKTLLTEWQPKFTTMTTAEYEQLKAYVDRLENALAPFADCAAGIELDESDQEWAMFRLLVANYRQVSQALASKPAILKD